MMREITVSGTPYEIGKQHGSQASEEIRRGVEFYTDLFQQNAKLSWSESCAVAEKFLPFLKGDEELKGYVEEMRGVATGSQQPLSTILALNVRTELAYGFPPTPDATDGCTAVSWLTPSSSFLAQNWDWQSEQSPNLIALTIQQTAGPTIKMVTEAGLIGKIGMNSSGVGVCLNAIKAPGISYGKLPCHLALRAVLDSPSAEVALQKLKKYGVASSCHIFLADSVSGGTGVECSAQDIVTISQNTHGQIFHSNHFIMPHSVESKLYLPDSLFRLERIQELVKGLGDQSPSTEAIEKILDDEKGYPTAICRDKTEKSTVASLFSIVMDLQNKSAKVRVGRPIHATERVGLSF